MSSPFSLWPSTTAVSEVEAMVKTNPRAALARAETLLKSGLDERLCRAAAAACRALGEDGKAEAAELAAIKAALRRDDMADVAEAIKERQPQLAAALLGAILKSEPENLLALTLAA